MKQIFLIRHCQAIGQAPDAPLTELGQQQALQLAEMLKDFLIERVVSSPYRRAVDTIQPFCERSSLPLHTDVRLVERVLSTEQHRDWVAKLEASFADLELKYEGGESSQEAMDRGVQVIQEWLRAPSAGCTLAVVTHGALI
ncbi:histidine phosphatase family protein [Paenibacillus koleovorans]|uniref:histidine phosphatase family protein n=1 Tax=Paenibacillus koleovorans TaxID=121608 RepID=UPI001FE69842|nr:histidine phosphatase family protein [Paenibacillus koleovorans]